MASFSVIYLSSFKLSKERINNPNIYPYNVFHGKDVEPFVFSPVTVLYGNNGSGKSTILNIIANKLMLKGKGNAGLVSEMMSLGIQLENFRRIAGLLRARIFYTRSKKFSKDRFWLMAWNMII